jgi:hypothetical protein
MRYVSLLFFGAFGVALLFLAYNRFQSAASFVASANAVEGTVKSLTNDGDFLLAYRVGSEDYTIQRSVPINYFPKIKVGDTVPLLYTSDRPDYANFSHWSRVYEQFNVCAFLGAMAMIAAIGSFLMFGMDGTPPAQVVVVTALDHPIDLRSTWKEFWTGMVVSLIPCLFAFAIYRVTHDRWPWLSYIGVAFFVLLALGLMWATAFSKSIQIHADQDGVQIKDNDGVRRFPWTDVAALKRETTTRNVLHERADGTRDHTVEEMTHDFCLLDATGKELLRLNEDAPMEPLNDWMLLRGYIRGRTGLPVKEETKKNILGDSIDTDGGRAR